MDDLSKLTKPLLIDHISELNALIKILDQAVLPERHSLNARIKQLESELKRKDEVLSAYRELKFAKGSKQLNIRRKIRELENDA